MAYSFHGFFGDVETPDMVLRSLFSKYDKDNSGTLAGTELQQFLEEDLGMNTEDDLYLLHQFIDEGEYGMAKLFKNL